MFSMKHFYHFISVMDHKDVISPEKLRKWQDTLREFHAVMTGSECDDLRCLDVESLSKRYVDLVSQQKISITPWLIHTRKKLLQNAVGNFVAYTINPGQYCSSMKQTVMPRTHTASIGAVNSARAAAAVARQVPTLTAV